MPAVLTFGQSSAGLLFARAGYVSLVAEHAGDDEYDYYDSCRDGLFMFHEDRLFLTEGVCLRALLFFKICHLCL